MDTKKLLRLISIVMLIVAVVLFTALSLALHLEVFFTSAV